MMISRHDTKRPGATAVETAIVLMLLFVLIFGIISGGWMVFRYQQMACLAREGARWACVRGSEYQRDVNKESPTKQMIVDQAILPYSAGLDPAALAVTVTVIDKNTGVETDWDASKQYVRTITTGRGEYISNTVRVTVTYSGVLAFFGDAYSVASRCEIPISH